MGLSERAFRTEAKQRSRAIAIAAGGCGFKHAAPGLMSRAQLAPMTVVGAALAMSCPIRPKRPSRVQNGFHVGLRVYFK